MLKSAGVVPAAVVFVRLELSTDRYRERAPETIVAWAEEALAASGFEEISLLSLSTGDYGCLSPLLTCLMDCLEKRRIALSLPSMRADTLPRQSYGTN